MPASTNTLKEVKASDLLQDIRQKEAEAEAGKTAVGFSAQFYIGPLGVLEDEILISDSLVIASDATGGDFIQLQDTANVSDLISLGTSNPAEYSMPEYGYLTEQGASIYYGNQPFFSSSAGGFFPAAPIVIGFWELGT